MPLTTTQIFTIKHYLGYSASAGPAIMPVQAQLESLNANEDFATMATDILTKLAAIETDLDDLSIAGLRKSEEIEFQNKATGASSHHSALRSAGRRQVSRLSVLCGIGVLNDVFSESVSLESATVDLGFISTHSKC